MHFLLAIAFSLSYISCESEMSVITTCSPFIHSDLRYADVVNDPSTNIKEVWIQENCLNLKLEYSGGCSDHIIELITPTLQNLEINPNGKNDLLIELFHVNEDQCEALVTEDYGFDLSEFSSIANEWEFHFTGTAKSIKYKFEFNSEELNVK